MNLRISLLVYLLGFSFINSNAQLIDLSKGNICYFPFSGNTNNISPNRIDGTDALLKGPSASYDKNNQFNKAFTFDGIDDYIQIENAISLKQFSISLWYNTTSNSKGHLVYWESADLNIKMSDLHKEKGKLSINFDGYLGGVPYLASYYQGRLDEVLLYNRALNDAEANTIYKSSKINFNKKLDNGLIYHLPFDGHPLNRSQNVLCGLEGQINGASESFDRFDEMNKARHFDGINDYILLGDKAKHPLVSCSFWINTTSTATSQILGWEDAGFNITINPENQEGKIAVNLYVKDSKFAFLSSQNVNDGKWHFAAFTYDGTSLKGYLDGQIIYHDSKAGGYRPILYQSDELSIGKCKNSFFQGRLDDIRIYNRGLKISEVNALLNEAPQQYVEIKSHFSKNQTLVVDFKNLIKEKVEVYIYNTRGSELEKLKMKSTEQLIHSLVKHPTNEFIIKIKMGKKWFENKLTFYPKTNI